MGTKRIGAVFLTGQSDYRSCSLSPIQQKIEHELTRLDVEVQPLNFPYQEQMAPYREVNILFASLTNITIFFQSRRLSFAQRHRDQLCEISSQNAITLVLAGSCGLEIFNNLRLPNEVTKKMHIFAYGPVARKIPDSTFTFIQGKNDWLSKCFFSNVLNSVKCGHMDYLQSPEVLAILKCTVEKLRLETEG